MLKVIIVDDNVRTADGLARSLDFASVGFECAGVAYNGRQALDLVRRHQPNAVITDVRMPIMDGLELARHLREEYPGIAILILSAYDEFEYAKTAIDYGVASYLLKPLDRKKLDSVMAFLRDIRNRIDHLSASLSTVTDRRNLERLFTNLQKADREGAAAFVREVLAGSGPDFDTAQRVAAALVSSLHDHAGRNLPADQNPLLHLDALMERIETESRTEGLVAAVTEMAIRLCDAVASARNFATRHIVGAILAYIDGHFADPDLSARQVMDRFNVSQSYLCQIFRRYKGTSLNTHLTTLRMEHAARLLSDRGIPVASVAQASGYADPHYFSRVFRKYHGLSPVEYRRARQGPPENRP